jgi:hypothetical protein
MILNFNKIKVASGFLLVFEKLKHPTSNKLSQRADYFVRKKSCSNKQQQCV